MIKLKDEIDISELTKYGFVKERWCYTLSIGAFTLYCNSETKRIKGIGFYSVGDRITMRHLNDLKMQNLIEQISK